MHDHWFWIRWSVCSAYASTYYPRVILAFVKKIWKSWLQLSMRIVYRTFLSAALLVAVAILPQVRISPLVWWVKVLCGTRLLRNTKMPPKSSRSMVRFNFEFYNNDQYWKTISFTLQIEFSISYADLIIWWIELSQRAWSIWKSINDHKIVNVQIVSPRYSAHCTRGERGSSGHQRNAVDQFVARRGCGLTKLQIPNSIFQMIKNKKCLTFRYIQHHCLAIFTSYIKKKKRT